MPHHARRRLRAAALSAAAVGAGLSALPATAAARGAHAVASSPQIAAFAVPGDYSSVSSTVDPALAPAPSGSGEWFVNDDGSSSVPLMQVTPQGVFSTVTTLAGGGNEFTGAAQAGGRDWFSVDGGDLFAVDGSGNASDAGPVGGDGRDMVVGPDGNLYISDNSGSIIACTPTAPTVCVPDLLSTAFADPAPEGIASAGGQLWFNTDAYELGSMTPAAGFAGPFGDSDATGPAGDYSDDLAAAPGGPLYVAGDEQNSDSAQPDQIIAVNPASGAVEQVYGAAAGMPDGAGVTSLAVGPDGNVWFTDEGNDAIGELVTATGQITEYQLPDDIDLQDGSDEIVPGPAGSDTMFFTAESDDTSGPAIGEVVLPGGTLPSSQFLAGDDSGDSGSGSSSSTGTSSGAKSKAAAGAAGKLSVLSPAAVSRSRYVALKLSCSGATGSLCSGKLKLTETVVTVTGKGRHRHRRSRTVTFGTAGYRLGATHKATVRLRLSAAHYGAVSKHARHRLTLRELITPGHGGAATSAKLTLVARR